MPVFGFVYILVKDFFHTFGLKSLNGKAFFKQSFNSKAWPEVLRTVLRRTYGIS